MNWNCCLICREKQEMQEVKPTVVGFQSFIDILQKWKSIGVMPTGISSTHVDKIIILSAETLKENGAFWHKSCYNRCDKQKFNRKILSNAQPQSVKHVLESTTIEETVESESIVTNTPEATRLKVNAKKKKNCCFFVNMHLSATNELDEKVRKYASIIDEKLLIKLVEGGMTAIDATYHLQCLVKFYNVRQKTSSNKTKEMFDQTSLAFAKVVDYVNSKCGEDLTTVAIFKLSELKALYLEYIGDSANDSKSYTLNTFQG